MYCKKIESIETLGKQITEFDTKNHCQTNFLKIPFNELNRDVLKIQSSNESGILSHQFGPKDVIPEIFKKKTHLSHKIVNQRQDVDKDLFHKLCGMFLLWQDFKNNKQIVDPIIVTQLPNEKIVIDPGGTRIMFGHLDNKLVDVMFINYKKNIVDSVLSRYSVIRYTKDYQPNLFANYNTFNVNEFSFINQQSLFYMQCQTGEKNSPKLLGSSMKGINWHGIVGISGEKKYWHEKEEMQKLDFNFEFNKNDQTIACNNTIFIALNHVTGKFDFI